MYFLYWANVVCRRWQNICLLYMLFMQLCLRHHQHSSFLTKTQWTEAWYANAFLCDSWIWLSLIVSLAINDWDTSPAQVLSDVQFRPRVFVDMMFVIQWNRAFEHVKSKLKETGLGPDSATQRVIKDLMSSSKLDSDP